jgi:hypothetical protein
MFRSFSLALCFVLNAVSLVGQRKARLETPGYAKDAIGL